MESNKRNRVIVTVLGADRVGIVAGITTVLAESNANIIDLTSTQMKGMFVMMMMVDITDSPLTLSELQDRLQKRAEELQVQVIAQHEDVFRYMHRI